MKYWLDLFTPHTWTRFQEHGAGISGFRPRQRKTAFGKVETGDYFICYLVKLSRGCGLLEVISPAFEDSDPIFAEENDPFTIRFRVKPLVLLDFEKSFRSASRQFGRNCLSREKLLPAHSAGPRLPSCDSRWFPSTPKTGRSLQIDLTSKVVTSENMHSTHRIFDRLPIERSSAPKSER